MSPTGGRLPHSRAAKVNSIQASDPASNGVVGDDLQVPSLGLLVH